MKINTKYLREFIDCNFDTVWIKNLLETMGLEVAEISDYKGVDVIEVESTPNRPDWLSHFGIARDMVAKSPNLKLIEYNNKTKLTEINDDGKKFNINIENPDDCSRYSGCIVRDVTVGESSDEVKNILLSLGLRPINSIVDISNIMLMAYGHPIHIFDFDKIDGKQINIRRAKKGESLKLLDEQKIVLDSEFLVIAGEKEPIALAGIMGGLNSGVSLETKNIFIESASFNPVVVRKPARRIGLSTDSSFRFERGTDILCTVDIIEKTIDLIKSSSKSDIKITYFNDVYPKPFVQQKVIMEKEFPSRYSGIDIENKESEQILNRLGFATIDKDDFWEVNVPSFRVDVYGKQDLIEEIVRIYGYDNLESVLPDVSTSKIKKWSARKLKASIGQFLVGNGAYEVINYSFQKESDNLFFGDKEHNIEIKNPLGVDFSFMRNSLISGILKNMASNLNQFSKDILMYEFGKIFTLKNNEIVQINMFTLGASGIYRKKDWRTKKGVNWDIYLFKGIVLNLFSSIFIDVEFESSEKDYYKSGTVFKIVHNGITLGMIGELNDDVSMSYKINDSVFISEFDFDVLNRVKRVFKLKKWNIFPSTKRDFSFFVDKNNSFESIKKVINDIKPDNLVNFELFDLYEGKGNPEGKVSMSMSFTYQDEFKTLENNEVNVIHKAFIEKMSDMLKLIQR
jgi:phenylalanyl-tRNA synthetase beta chain